TALAAAGEALLVAAGSSIWRLPPGGASPERLATLGAAVIFDLAVRGDAVPVEIFAATRDGVYLLRGDASRPRLALELELGARRVAVAPRGCPVAIAAEAGLLVADCGANGDASTWTRLLSRAGRRSWAPVEVGAVAFAGDGTLWLGSPQGLVRRDPAGATVLYDGGDGLPWTDFTAAAPAPDGGVWLGTRLGAIHRFAEAGAGDRVSGTWEYRQGRRWLPHDDVRDVVVDGSGAAWMATAGAVARIARVPMTLAEKARFFEAEIDRFHRRTPYGYVDAVRLGAPGDRARFEQRSSDNDGLWTGMYGAAECFAYAATRRPEARARADAAFRALAFLSEVTQGGSHPAPPGFVARSILPTSGPDPNAGRLEEDRRRRREEDALWKVITPRWPTDASGQWYWKTDASSDELDGHFFLYALYHDLVAETEAERAEVRAVVTGIVDHLLEHDYALHDHDGEPTRWAVFGPAQLNHDPMWWGERGLNSLSILSYLRVAAHVSRAAGGSERYDRAARELIERHGYAANVRVPKIHTGPGTGNQSDDEMAFMSFWNLLRYERDPELRALWGHAFHRYWLMERPERNPLFAFLYAASVRGLAWRGAFDTTAFGLDSDDEALEDAIDTLERYPLDRVDWALRNSHRHDVVLLATDPDDGRGGARGRRHDGKVLPIDERFVDHWNHDPWRLDHGGEGRKLGDGASFLLPYYLGLYEGFLSE
ncbi:MAG TPA: hypothetical protein VMS86_13990, partial [Thermoanaerobaculia bacterium]|nr:hypothetical protein [Thermoanaerobaculia bacterium]